MFATHRSDRLRSYVDADAIDIGIHPNCFDGSDQGKDADEVLSFLLGLYPEATISRSHGYYDNSRFAARVFAHGLRYDSNTCHIGLPAIAPIPMWTGITRLPVFWEDDIHWAQGKRFVMDQAFRETLTTPGLKILDIHPVHYGFNVDGAAHYEVIKAMTCTATHDDLRRHANAGPGVATFLTSIFDCLDDAKIAVTSFRDWKSRFESISTCASIWSPR
nr:hypothetical protein [Tsuneonella troitsensis]